MTDDLITWLRGVLDEDAASADEVHALDCELAMTAGYHGPCTCHRPAFLLEDIAAKRAIVDLHGWDSHECPAPSDEWGPYTAYEPNCRTLRLLATAYASRPGYQDAWRP